jgi:hypothetical protein
MIVRLCSGLLLALVLVSAPAFAGTNRVDP